MAKDNNLRYEESKVINEHFHRYEGVEQKSKTLPYLILEGEAKGNNELDFPNTSRNQGTNSKAAKNRFYWQWFGYRWADCFSSVQCFKR